MPHVEQCVSVEVYRPYWLWILELPTRWLSGWVTKVRVNDGAWMRLREWNAS